MVTATEQKIPGHARFGLQESQPVPSLVQVQEILDEFKSEIDEMLRIPSISKFYKAYHYAVDDASCHRTNTF